MSNRLIWQGFERLSLICNEENCSFKLNGYGVIRSSYRLENYSDTNHSTFRKRSPADVKEYQIIYISSLCFNLIFIYKVSMGRWIKNVNSGFLTFGLGQLGMCQWFFKFKIMRENCYEFQHIFSLGWAKICKKAWVLRLALWWGEYRVNI